MLAQKIKAWALSTVEDHSSCLHLAKAGFCHHRVWFVAGFPHVFYKLWLVGVVARVS